MLNRYIRLVFHRVNTRSGQSVSPLFLEFPINESFLNAMQSTKVTHVDFITFEKMSVDVPDLQKIIPKNGAKPFLASASQPNTEITDMET